LIGFAISDSILMMLAMLFFRSKKLFDEKARDGNIKASLFMDGKGGGM